MNVNRQNNCNSGRPGVRPVNVIGASPCCNDMPVVPLAAPCRNDGISAVLIPGGHFDAGCNKETTLAGCPVAMAYVPWQDYGNIYPMQQAIRNGTVFSELYLDFAGRRCN